MKKQNINWPSLVKEWQQSNESQTAFCQNRNLAYWTFRAHLKKNGASPATPRHRKKETPFIKLPTEKFPESRNAQQYDKAWLAIHLGPDGFRFQVNFRWGR
ncbi:MAG: hypothetical protein ABUK01_18920 [Leptospirales bacterium]